MGHPGLRRCADEVVAGGFGGTRKDAEADLDAEQARKAEGYGGGEDMDRGVGG